MTIVQGNRPLACKVETHKHRIGDIPDLKPGHCSTGNYLTMIYIIEVFKRVAKTFDHGAWAMDCADLPYR